jgi:Family of unknown function (DUF6152)
MRTTMGMTAALGLIASLTGPILAHHSFSTEYDASKKVKLTGVVTNVAWTNPHMRVYIDVTDASGKVTNWNLELTSPNSVRRQGWGKNDLKAGDKVIFEGYAGKVVESRGALASIAKVETPERKLLVQGGPQATERASQP